MSRWLSSLSQVSNLLEKLDDRVENVVEERAIAIEDEDIVTDHEVIIDDILSKRGLAADSKEEEEEAEEEVNELDVDVDDDNVSAQNPEDPVSKKDDGEDKIHISQSIDTAEPTGGTQDDNSKSGQDPSIPTGSATELQHDSNIGENRISAETLDDKVVVVVDAQPLRTEDTQPPKSLGALPTNSSKSKKEIELSLASKEAQKEVRVLRRHVVKLNSTLEQAEGEILALRDELGRAAERMEKDRTRAKELKEAAQKTQVEELATIRKQHEQALKDQQIRFEEQLETYKSTLSELENRRKQEGGDWNKEIAQAFEREQEMNNRVTLLEDEKTVLLNQIATLQSQQVALGSRVESLTQTSENAITREREAEDRLDAVLSQHARQISQRQAREAELERTIHQLNSALVLRANKEETSSSQNSDGKSAGEPSFRARIEALESDLNASHSQLALEKEKSELLHQQLKEMSKESTQEASSIQVQQLQYQRRVAEMTLTISRLEANLRDAQKEFSNRDGSQNNAIGDDELAQQVQLLSEEVLRLRDKLGNSSSELKTLKSRLHVALERASKAEDELMSASAAAAATGSDIYDSMELGSGARDSSSIMARRRKPSGHQSGTIRAAMRLNPGQGDRAEQIARVVDAVDGFAVTTGKYLRKNPMARAGFIVYLLLMHMWTFVLLFLHAHNFESAKGDYMGIAVGPHALLEQHMQIAENAVSEVKVGAN